MTLSIVSVALMSLSIQTAMSGPVQQQGAEKKGLLKESTREFFDVTLSSLCLSKEKKD